MACGLGLPDAEDCAARSTDRQDMTDEPAEMELGDELPTALYRFYAAGDVRLYIGITDHLRSRFAQHAKTQPWWPEVVRKTVVWYPTRAEAAAAELAAIDREKPVHNIVGAGRWWRLQEWRVLEYDPREGVDLDRVQALALDTAISPIALKLGMFYISGRSTEEAVKLLKIGRSHFASAVQDLKAAGHIAP